MKNQKIIPYERNRYFYGKLMTVRDFEIEQRYHNDKRRLMNRLFVGPGIVAGLGVLTVDDKTVLVEPGVALDYLGREIVVESPHISRLSVVDGFDTLPDYGEAYLNLDYSESPREAVHNVSASNQSGGSQAEYNRIFEDFQISLSTEAPSSTHQLSEMLRQKTYTLLEIPEYSISLSLPCIASIPEGAEVVLILHRKKPTAPVNAKIKLKARYLNYGQPIELSLDESMLPAAERQRLSWHFPLSQVQPQDDLIECLEVVIEQGNQTVPYTAGVFNHMLSLGIETYSELIVSRFRQLSLDDLLSASADDRICLAKLRVLKTDKTYVIEAVEIDPLMQLIPNVKLSQILKAESSPKLEAKGLNPSKAAVKQEEVGTAVSQRLENAGKYNFEFKHRVSGRDKFFSNEINHDLGTGNVSIVLAVDSESSDGESSYGYQNQLVFGDYDLFEKSSYEPVVPKLKMASVAYKNKGSFIIGIQFLEGYSKDQLTIQWHAFKADGKGQRLQSVGSGLNIEPAMSKVKTRTQISFNVFHDGLPMSCNWKVKESGGGEIDASGVYMSPSVEGVYEIIAEVTDLNETLSAFVIVEN